MVYIVQWLYIGYAIFRATAYIVFFPLYVLALHVAMLPVGCIDPYPPTTRAQWLERRRLLQYSYSRQYKRLGGSSCDQLLNINSIYRLHAALCMAVSDKDAADDEKLSMTAFGRDACDYGTAMEPYARVVVQHMLATQHSSVPPVLYNGTIIEDITHTFEPHYIVSTDGLIMISNKVAAILEIKCPYIMDISKLSDWSHFPCQLHPKYYAQAELYCRAYNVSSVLYAFFFPALAYPRVRVTDWTLTQLRDHIISEPDYCSSTVRLLHYHRSDGLWELIDKRCNYLFECLHSGRVPVRGECDLLRVGNDSVEQAASAWRSTNGPGIPFGPPVAPASEPRAHCSRSCTDSDAD